MTQSLKSEVESFNDAIEGLMWALIMWKGTRLGFRALYICIYAFVIADILHSIDLHTYLYIDICI